MQAFRYKRITINLWETGYAETFKNGAEYAMNNGFIEIHHPDGCLVYDAEMIKQIICTNYDTEAN